MGDPQAAKLCKQILARSLTAPSGSRHRDMGRYLAYLLKARVATRASFLPQKGSKPRTPLARRLHAIFNNHGGQVHLTARAA